MINLQQAIELATKAHEGQWREFGEMTYQDVQKLLNIQQVPNKHEQVLDDGSKLIWRDLWEVWYYYIPYITHPLAVMDMMNTEEEKIVAILHDVLEDTKVTFNNLKNAGISNNCLGALMLLTHIGNESYTQYISKICTNKLATKVKLADIFHNMSCNPSEHAKQKYLKVIPILLKSI